MKKDVVYIDTEDDITAIIERVKDAKSSIVALVPPKRVGVLQSIVNLKLLKRAAEQADKRIVLITNDPALSNLAAELLLPIAKNLQSKPELSTPVVVEGIDDDVIQGEEIEPTNNLDSVDSEVEIFPNNLEDEVNTADDSRKSFKSSAGSVAISDVAKKRSITNKLPNFNMFRKKLFIAVGGLLLLVGFVVWATVFAPRADVVIKARTNVININKVLQIRDGAKVDAAQNVLPSVVKQIKKATSADLTATGKKDVGDKATGTVKLANSSFTAVTLNAGVVLRTSSGLQFTTNTTVTVPKGSCASVFNCTAGSATVGVTAASNGPTYNGASGSMSGAPSDLTATLTEETSGGTTKEVTVISQVDVDKAFEQLKSQDSNAVREELKKQFTSAEIAINDAFVVEPGNPVATPAVGQEATSGKLTLETTYTLIGVKTNDLSQVYSAFLKTELSNKKNQKIYEVGEKSTKFSEFNKVEGGYTIRAVATAQVGPNIDQAKLIRDIAGLREGDVREMVNAIDGIEDVDVKFSPFWVNSVPKDDKKVHIIFTMTNGN
ncbi:hypothetical protein EOL73_01175 [Candidatus Saccharibacteria bacterium]|nr:hypothetical protein [Candidatus Saccharibacteria bacterium]